ncbi:hypothetical protein RF11_11643 [Thelohanellus kitauei]|uniref:Uncharacterized protein n=1 Tax=Thelohanellus kitauei TaxID=669202 RepID=A0A0C2ICV2_THEKT|nr:hypothetical protein RF11_11643 [Thelohanellus kitauei]
MKILHQARNSSPKTAEVDTVGWRRSVLFQYDPVFFLKACLLLPKSKNWNQRNQQLLGPFLVFQLAFLLRTFPKFKPRHILWLWNITKISHKMGLSESEIRSGIKSSRLLIWLISGDQFETTVVLNYPRIRICDFTPQIDNEISCKTICSKIKKTKFIEHLNQSAKPLVIL